MTPFRTLILSCSVAILPGPRSGAQATPISRDRMVALDSQLPLLLKKHRVAAVGAAIIREGRIVWTKVYGEQGPGVAATPRTMFNVASLTKMVTAETILRLVEAGKISLDESMADYWVDPDIASDPRHRLLTPRIALSHQTGFLNWRRMSKSGKLAFVFDPGTDFGYSGEGYTYLARFAEKKLGRPFESLVDEYVFRPIGLKNTSYTARDWMKGRIAIPMDTAGKFGAPDLQAAGDWNAADDLFVTVTDYATFMISVMNHEGLSPALATERMRRHRSATGEWPCFVEPVSLCPDWYGYTLGWQRFDYGQQSVISHGGDDWGEHALAYFYPGTRDGIVVLVNGGNGFPFELDALDLLDAHTPITAYAQAKSGPVATYFRALLAAALAGKLPGQKP